MVTGEDLPALVQRWTAGRSLEILRRASTLTMCSGRFLNERPMLAYLTP